MPSPFSSSMPGPSQLDGPPPPPGPMGGVPDSGPGQLPTLAGLGTPIPMGSGQLPPEILTGILQAAQKISGMFDAFAQVTPDLAMDWDLLKMMLEKTLGKVMAAGGGPASPTATGPQFPGGGMDQGKAQPPQVG